MACSTQTEIVSAQDDDCRQTESTPLVVKSSIVRRGGLLGRLRESVLIKSKAANMILFWSTMVHFYYGMAINPNCVFIISQSLEGKVPFISTIGSGVYGLIAVWLLFYPLAGYLADVRYGRYKVVMVGLFIIWYALALLAAGVCINALFWALYYSQNTAAVSSEFGLRVVIYAISGVAGFLDLLILFIGFAAFAANVVQFGIDQLRDLPTRDSFLFIHWLLFTQYIGVSIGLFVWSISFVTLFTSLGTFALGWLLLTFVMPISFGIATKSRWFVTDTGLGNPYREVARVVGFARRHKVPIQRSAFTYWEDDIPTGLDLGKSKYGGPFTTEQVENVKAFFGILSIVLSLGPFFTADIAASAFLPILKHHMEIWTSQKLFDPDSILYSMFANGGTLYPLFIVIMIPIFLKIIHPLFRRYMPSILKRVGIGLCLITISLLCSLLIDTIGHALPSGQNATSVFNPDQTTVMLNNSFLYFTVVHVDAPSLHLSPYLLTIQNFLVAVAYILIYGGVFEFICAQSPHSMKGVLIGIFFAVKGLFQLIGVLGILLPFSFWQNSPRVGLTYFLVNIVISVVGVVAFIVRARRYQYRQRDEFCNIRKYIEDFYEKEVRHNHKFEELDINFSHDSDPED